MHASSYLTLKTPLDGSVRRKRKFDLQLVKGEEKLCGDFSYALEICCPERLVEDDIKTLVGNHVTIRIGYDLNDQASYRFINGTVYRLRELGMRRAPLTPDIWQYRLEISSWLKQLSFAKECRIFRKNNHTNINIVTDLLTELGMNAFRNQTTKTFSKKDYVTIYNESYYDFIIRLLQEEGIVWRFKHEQNRHTLVFADDSSNLPEIPAASWPGGDRFLSFCRRSRYNALDGCQLADFEYDNPPGKLVGKQGTSVFRHFEYPGKFTARTDGEEKAARLKSVYRSNTLLFRGTSTIRALEAGTRFTLTAPMLPDYHQQAFTIKKLSIEASPTLYKNTVEVFPAKEPFFYAPEDKVKKPCIIGNQTAVVTGSKTASGVHTDEQGRVRVRFHWDRHSPAATGSAFIRNVLPAAGARRGFIFNPAVGDEVVVAFENGDPDRPLIIGRVYSANQPSPVLPEKKPRQSVIQARDGNNANRILFDDKQGAENLQFTAKKDMNIKVGGNLTIKVNNDLSMTGRNLDVESKGNSITGNIIRLALKGIDSKAGKSITNATGLAVANITGAVMDKKAGGHAVNMALGMVDSASGGATVSKSPLIVNTCARDIQKTGKKGVSSKGLVITNTGLDLIENTAGQDMVQDAALAVISKTKNEKNKISSETSTKALMVKNSGNTVINKD